MSYHEPYPYDDSDYPRRAIERERRIGNVHRNAAIDRLDYNIAHGYLTEDEGEERRALILAAKTEEVLTRLLLDLAEQEVPADAPPSIRVRDKLHHVRWGKPHVFLSVGLGGIAFSLMAAIVPGAVMAAIPAGKGSIASTAPGLAIWIPLLILGIMGIMGSIVAMSVMSDIDT